MNICGLCASVVQGFYAFCDALLREDDGRRDDSTFCDSLLCGNDGGIFDSYHFLKKSCSVFFMRQVVRKIIKQMLNVYLKMSR